MPYDLGVDVGVSTTSAVALFDAGRAGADPSIVAIPLGSASASMASAVHLHADGALSVGDAAVRAGWVDPGGGARELRRRLGDPAPILLRTTPYAAEQLVAELLGAAVTTAAERFDERPRRVGVSHPADWGSHKLAALHRALEHAGLADATLVSEPVAAALGCTGAAALPAGTLLGCYDLGGATFTAAVLRRTPSGFEAVGEPVGIDPLGGADVDELLLQHVRRAVGERWPSDPSDPSLPAPMLQLRRDCAAAKEQLSTEPSATIAVNLPGVATTVIVTRAELDALVAPRLEETADALDRAAWSAGTEPGALTALVAVGGCAALGAVRQLLGARYPAATLLAASPTHAVALGAAAAARAAARPTTGAATPPPGAMAAMGPPQGAPVPVMGPPQGAPLPGAGAPVPPPGPPPVPAPTPGAPAPGAATVLAVPGGTAVGGVASAPTLAAAPGPAAASEAEPVRSAATTAATRRGGTGRAVWAVVLAVFAIMAVAGPYKMLRGTPSAGGGTVVRMAGTRFAPGVLTVPKGTVVRFVNDDVQAHTVTGDGASPAVDSGILEAGGAFELTATERFTYFCAIHPSMTGTIEIGG